MAFKMKGFSPFTKHEPGHEEQVPLSEHEDKKGTMITGGSKSEAMVDLEDRIEFLNSDIEELTANDEQSRENTNKVLELRNTKKKLHKRLSEMRKSSPVKDMKTGSYKQKFE